MYSSKKDDVRSRWVQNLYEKKGMNRTTVAIANRNARIIWSVVKNNTVYKTSNKLEEMAA